MSGPVDGKYLILSSAKASASIGADEANQPTVKPVLVDSEVKVWTIQNAGDGTYKIFLKDNWYSTKDSTGLQVVVDINTDPGTRWKIVPKDGSYMIQSTDAEKVWTPSTLEPRNAVWINSIANPVDKAQLWNLLPVQQP